ncbi:Porin [Jannaschia seosinensis]|uniref:Porin n=1 Tax=Jannaschia seosinensis TaxID=313367 RepID=A0A0M7BF41_9RHOB|nr:porin [Jannaschia seosinensis]CUH40698.1 Porin [Jannaschia seosinensis]
MKKVLFASTALVAFAGAASAEVTLSGFAEMGVFSGNGGVATTDDDAEFFTDIDVTFTLTGETDGGLVFGGSVDLDEGGDGSDANDNNREDGGATIFVSGAFGTLTMGDTDGALDWALTEVAFNAGSINDDATEHAGYNGNAALDGTYDGQILRYDYAVGDFGVAVSAEINDEGRAGTPGFTDVDGNIFRPVPASNDGDVVWGLGATYQADFAGYDLGFGLGYQEADDAEALGFSVNTSVAGFQVGLNYTEYDGNQYDFVVVSSGNLTTELSADIKDHVGVGVGYDFAGVQLHANYGVYDTESGNIDGFGLTAGYDLGGGAIVQLGYGDSNFDSGLNTDDFETVSLGLALAF